MQAEHERQAQQMTSQSLMKALEIILLDSFDITKKRGIGSTRYSGTVTLSPEDQALLTAKIAEVNGCSAEEALALYDKKSEEVFRKAALGLKARWSVAFLLGFFALVLGVWLYEKYSYSFYFLFYPLGLLLLVLLWRLFTSRSRRMEKAWKVHKASGDGILQGVEKLAEIAEKPFLKAAGKPAMIALILVVLAAAAVVVAPMLPDGVHKQVATLTWNSNAPEEDLSKALELLLPMDAKQAQRTLSKGVKVYNPDTHILAFAEMANRLADAGVLSRETAHEWDMQAFQTLDFGMSNLYGEELVWLFNLLDRLEKADADTLIVRFLEDGKHFIGVLAEMAEYCERNRTTAELMALAKYKRVEFLQAALANDDLAKLQQRMEELDDPSQRAELARCAASNYTQPDDVQAFLHMAQEVGLTPADCYPNGVPLD